MNPACGVIAPAGVRVDAARARAWGCGEVDASERPRAPGYVSGLEIAKDGVHAVERVG